MHRNFATLCAQKHKKYILTTRCSQEDSELLQNFYAFLHKVSQKQDKIIQMLELFFLKISQYIAVLHSS